MRNKLLQILLVITALGTCFPQPAIAQIDATGTWLAMDVPYAPWIVKLKQNGTTLTGTVEQSGALRGPVDIYEGTLDGTAISFKVNSPASAVPITFTGTFNRDEIVLSRSGGNPGGNGLFGALAAPQFTVKRETAAAAAGLMTPPGSVRAEPRATASPTGSQRWVVSEGIAFKPWILDLKIEGDAVTGTVGQANADPASGYVTSLTGPFPIYDGTVDGNKLNFKVNTPDGGRIVTFRGVRGDDAMAFSRSVEVLRGDPGRDGILGGSGATQFVATLKPGYIPPATSIASPSPPRARADAPPVVAAGTSPAGIWQATGVPNAPWTFDFSVAGTSLTGTIRQSGAASSPMSLAAGKVDGATILFKVLSPDAERLIAFQGRVNGNEISLVRQITPIADGTRGGNDLYGGSAPLQFVATRAAAPGRFNFKGMDVDISSVAASPNLDAVLESVRRQIDIVDEAITDPAQKAFLKSVPLVMDASPAAAPDNAAYSGATRSVALQSLSYSPEKPVILHELMHAYHDQRVPNGFANAEIQALYDQAKASGQFPPGSYMLSRLPEYFAMMASVYLHGTAARDPFTRQAILEKQPDCYQWLVKEFGPR